MSDTQRDIYRDKVLDFMDATAGMGFIPDTAELMFEKGQYEGLDLFMGGVREAYPDLFETWHAAQDHFYETEQFSNEGVELDDEGRVATDVF